jgi:hypothetical protein
MKERSMERIDADKYLVLIRSDYLYGLSRRSSTRQGRDALIQEAVSFFLDNYSLAERRPIIQAEEDRVHISYSARSRPDYHMYLESVHLPDELVERMKAENRDPDFRVPIYDQLGTVLNAAIKVWLEQKHPAYLTA